MKKLPEPFSVIFKQYLVNDHQ